MDTLLKSEKAMEILASISLAQFLIILTIMVGIGVALFKFKDQVKNFLEKYRKNKNNQEDFVTMVKTHEDELIKLRQHHEEDMVTFYERQAQYRQQSLQKQATIDTRFDDINVKIDKLTKLISDQHEETQRIKRNELREKLLNSYRYYTSIENNPNQEWTNVEAEVFWQLYADYETLHGNGLMHSTVKPAMEALTVITIS